LKERSFVLRHALVLYFVLVFLISWLGSYLVVGTRFLRGEPAELSDIGLVAIPMLGAPFGVGILMTHLTNGRKGLEDLFSNMRKWRVGGRWYLPLAIFPLLLLSVMMGLSVLVSPEMAPSLVFPFIFIGLVVGLLEETGWTGFALPRMGLRQTALGAALLLGVIHGVWHFFADFLANYRAMGGFYWLLFNSGFFAHVVALRVLIAWVYANTESLFLAMMMHGVSTGFYGFFTFNLVNPELRSIFFLVYGALLWAPAIAVSLKYGKTLRA